MYSTLNIDIHGAYRELTKQFKRRVLILGIAFGGEDGKGQMLVWRCSGHILFVGIKSIRYIFDEEKVFDKYETE